jgi:hypothetical protein
MSVTVLNVIVLSVAMLSLIVLSVAMLCRYAEFDCAEYRYSEFHCAEFRYAECPGFVSKQLYLIIFAVVEIFLIILNDGILMHYNIKPLSLLYMLELSMIQALRLNILKAKFIKFVPCKCAKISWSVSS